jgi:hypothetical protein
VLSWRHFAAQSYTDGVQQEGEVMRIFVLIGLLAGSALCTGCGAPTLAYSAKERNSIIARTWSVDSHEIVDDFDSLLMLRPPSRMTIWHIR